LRYSGSGQGPSPRLPCKDWWAIGFALRWVGVYPKKNLFFRNNYDFCRDILYKTSLLAECCMAPEKQAATKDGQAEKGLHFGFVPVSKKGQPVVMEIQPAA